MVGNRSGDGKTVVGLKEAEGRIIYYSRKIIKIILIARRAEN